MTGVQTCALPILKAEVTIKTLWQMKMMLSIGYGRVIGEHALAIGS